MSHAGEMISTHPKPFGREGLVECIDACFDCAQSCITCADACLAEPTVATLVRCIRLNLDCTTVCQATGEIISRSRDAADTVARMQLQACLDACRVCAEECEIHAPHMAHCRVCAGVCRGCEEACRRLLASLGG